MGTIWGQSQGRSDGPRLAKHCGVYQLSESVCSLPKRKDREGDSNRG